MILNSIPTPPARPGRWHRPISRPMAFGLAAGFVGAAFVAFFGSFWLSMCGLFGETCSPDAVLGMKALSIVGLGLFVGGPLLVAWLRRALSWVFTPVVVVTVVFVGAHVVQFLNRLAWGR